MLIHPSLEWMEPPPGAFFICTPTQLDAIGKHPLHWDKHFLLGADIDLSELPTGFTPIGSATQPFTGVFNGQGRRVANFSWQDDTQSTVGFFRKVGAAAIIQDLHLTNVQVLGESSVGGLAGSSNRSIQRCSVIGVVVGMAANVGGLLGYSGYSDVVASHSSGLVQGNENVGGLIGTLASARVTRGSSSATVEGKKYTGGLVGLAMGNIDSSHATGRVRGTQYNGGLVGNSQPGSTIQTSFATGKVTGGYQTAGLVASNMALVHDCFATGETITGSSRTAGLIAATDGDIHRSYATEDVTGNTTMDSVASLVSYIRQGECFDLFFDATAKVTNLDSAGSVHSSCGEGLSRQLLQDVGSFDGWDFNAVWTLPVTGGPPILAWQTTPPYSAFCWQDFNFTHTTHDALGDGTAANPHLICSPAQLANIGANDCQGCEKHFRLMADIDLADYEGDSFNIIGTNSEGGVSPSFSGTLDGDNHVIRNFNYSASADNIGLFGTTTTSAMIHDLRLIRFTITGKRYVGGLVGYNLGQITNVTFLEFSINGDSDVGPLLGYDGS